MTHVWERSWSYRCAGCGDQVHVIEQTTTPRLEDRRRVCVCPTCGRHRQMQAPLTWQRSFGDFTAVVDEDES